MKPMQRILFKPNQSGASLQCDDCRTVGNVTLPYCTACGGHLSPRKNSSLHFDAMAALIGVGVVLLFWLARA